VRNLASEIQKLYPDHGAAEIAGMLNCSLSHVKKTITWINKEYPAEGTRDYMILKFVKDMLKSEKHYTNRRIAEMFSVSEHHVSAIRVTFGVSKRDTLSTMQMVIIMHDYGMSRKEMVSVLKQVKPMLRRPAQCVRNTLSYYGKKGHKLEPSYQDVRPACPLNSSWLSRPITGGANGSQLG